MLIGSHVSMGGKTMLLRASEEAASYGAYTFLIYTGAPQNSKRKPITGYNSPYKHEIALLRREITVPVLKQLDLDANTDMD